MGRNSQPAPSAQEYRWQVANDQAVKPVFDAYSFFEFTPGESRVKRYATSGTGTFTRRAIDEAQNLGGLASAADGSIILGNQVSVATPRKIGAWYLNTGGSVGLMRQRWGKPYNITNGDSTGRYVDGLPGASSFYIGVQADNSDDEIFTYGSGSYGKSASTGPITLWRRDDKPRKVLSGAGQDFVLGGWGRDTIAPGLDTELKAITRSLTGLPSDYDKLSAAQWLRVLGTQPSSNFHVPGLSRQLRGSDTKPIPATAVKRKAYAGGSMQDILIGGPQSDVLIGDRIAGTEGGILSYPDYKGYNRAPDVERRVNDLIGFPLKTTALQWRDPDKIASYNILNDLYRIEWKDSKNGATYYHNNWWPFGDFISGLEGDDIIHGDDTEADPARLIALKATAFVPGKAPDGKPSEDTNNLRAEGTIRDQLLINDSAGESQIGKSDPLFKNRTWDGRNNTGIYSFGNDVLVGGDGNDRIFGGFGGDLIIGGRGVDFIDSGEAVLAPGYKPIYGADVIWGDLPGKLKGDDLYPDIFNIGPLYLSEKEMVDASPNPDAKTLQEMQTEINKATEEFNKNSEDIKKALKIAGGIAKAIPKVGGVFGAMFKVGSLFLSKRSATQLIQDDSSPVTSAATVFIRDFDPLDVINLPFTEIYADNKPIKETQVRINVEAMPIGNEPFRDPSAFKQQPISQPSFNSNKSIEIKLQSDANKPQVARVVIERPAWLDDWARSVNPSASGDPLTNSNITNFIGYGVKRTKIERDSNPDNPANKLPQGQELYNTVYTFALPEALNQIALQNGQSMETFWTVHSPLALSEGIA